MTTPRKRRPQDLTQYSLRQIRRLIREGHTASRVLEARVSELTTDQANLAKAIRNLERRMSSRGLS